jgi:hypothetical protein
LTRNSSSGHHAVAKRWVFFQAETWVFFKTTSTQHAAFLDKYRARMDLSPQRWAERFPVALRIRPTHFRGYHQAGPDRPGIA